MKVSDALQQRKSVRAFLDKDVEPNTITAILKAARHAPSGTNIQPWQVAVVSGATKKKLQKEIESSFRSGTMGKADYRYYPHEWKNPYKSRRMSCARQMYNTLQIERKDKQRRFDQWAANYRAFDAPVMLLFFMDSTMQTGSFIDYGMFLQSIMLAAVEQGLGTCPQASLADFPEIIKSILGYPEESILLCGMALGYEDKEAPINNYRTPREDVESFTKFYT